MYKKLCTTLGNDDDPIFITVGDKWFGREVLRIDLDQHMPGYYVYTVTLEGQSYLHFPVTAIHYVEL